MFSEALQDIADNALSESISPVTGLSEEELLTQFYNLRADRIFAQHILPHDTAFHQHSDM